MAWEYHERIETVLLDLKRQGVFIVSAEVTTESVLYDEIVYPLPVCLVLGREYDGVSPEALAVSDAVVHLPMFGMANSINVSTTASVLLYHLERVRFR